jgi:hypothetical protein
VSTNELHDPRQPGAPDSPGDIPAERPASLDRLDVLIGRWEMDASFEAGYFGPGTPPITGRGGRTTFEWLEGRFFLTQRFVNEHPAAPSGIAIIGAGTDPKTFEQHYYDSRGVARVYQMSLDGGPPHCSTSQRAARPAREAVWPAAGQPVTGKGGSS